MNRKIMICMTMLVYAVLSYAHFDTLQEMQHYAQHMPEYPKTDNINWLQPDYTSFYKEYFAHSLFDNMLFALRLKKHPMWEAKNFKNLLDDLVAYREQNGFSGRHIMHITPKPGDRFVLWGDLQGAFHSLVRDLVELERRNILNNNLEIVHPEYYFVFNGNVINRSPYILETLTVVLRLMKNNPDRVFYIRGSGEDRESWHNLGTKEELKAKVGYLTQKTIPLDSEMKRFFNTLPLVLYLIGEQTKDSIKVVRIFNYAASTHEVDEGRFGNFFEVVHENRPTIHKVFDRTPTTKKVEIVANIKGEDRTLTYSKTMGMTHLGFQFGGIAWSLLSSPTSTYRKVYDFFWDAFTILHIHEKLSQWTLTLYNQDVRDKLGFVQSGEFNLISGFEITEKPRKKEYHDAIEMLQKKLRDLETELQRYKLSCPVNPVDASSLATTPAQQEKTLTPVIEGTHAESMSVRAHRIILGSTGDQKKTLRGKTYAIHAGSKMAFDFFNKEGGFRGKTIELVTFNDNYDPNQARKNILRLLNEVGVDIIFNPMGSQNVARYLDLVRDGKILLLFPQTGAMDLRNPELKYVVNFHASYYQEARLLAQYAVKNTSLRRFAILYQNDGFGVPPKDGAIKELEKHGIAPDNIISIPYNRADVNVAKQAEKLQAFGPEAIFLFTGPSWAKSLVRYLSAGYFVGKQCFTLSQISTDDFRNFMERDNGIPVIFTAQTPSPEYSQIPLVKEFRERVAAYGIEPTVSSLEGYIDAQLFIYLLSKIPKGHAITKEAIIAVVHSLVNEEYKGLRLHYNKENNTINDTIWLSTKKDENWIGIDPSAEEV